ncbi:MAG: S-layer homology domain-containing protein [Oscillospiraceae bacterium]
MRKRIITAMLTLGFMLSLAPALTGAALADYEVNGLQIPLPGYEVGAYANNCRTFAGEIYRLLWNAELSSYRGTDDDMLRELPEGEARRITPENTKAYISAAALGSAIRICDNIDGNDSQGTKMHSQILAQRDEEGFTVYEGNIGSRVRLKYFTWDEYVASWGRYTYFKYIKWPGALPFGSPDIDWSLPRYTDVGPDEWYFNCVGRTSAAGFISGVGDGRFAPEGELTNAEAVKLAACICQWQREGAITLRSVGGAQWWTEYAGYAQSSGVCPKLPTAWTASITRGELAALLYNALPPSEYRAIRDVPDGAIPDVAAASDFGARIYTLYRAGILTGTRGDGAFFPNEPVLRCEVAALVYRMCDSGARETLGALPPAAQPSAPIL